MVRNEEIGIVLLELQTCSAAKILKRRLELGCTSFHLIHLWAQIGGRHRHDFQDPVSNYASLCSRISINLVMKEEIRLFLA